VTLPNPLLARSRWTIDTHRPIAIHRESVLQVRFAPAGTERAAPDTGGPTLMFTGADGALWFAAFVGGQAMALRWRDQQAAAGWPDDDDLLERLRGLLHEAAVAFGGSCPAAA
jgi:hypothetical protein